MSSIYHQARKDIRALASFMSGLTALDVELEKLGGFEKVKLEAEARVTAAKASADRAEADLKAKLADIEQAGKDLISARAQASGALSDAADKAQRIAAEADRLTAKAKDDADQIIMAGNAAAAKAMSAVTDETAVHNKALWAAKERLDGVNAAIETQQQALALLTAHVAEFREKLGAV